MILRCGPTAGRLECGLGNVVFLAKRLLLQNHAAGFTFVKPGFYVQSIWDRSAQHLAPQLLKDRINYAQNPGLQIQESLAICRTG
jgi:hypothetical protein